MACERYKRIVDSIPESEWDDFFPNMAKPWYPSEIRYLREWYGREDTLSLSYALGRTPWSLASMANRLGLHAEREN